MASTKRENWALVTSVLSAQKPSTLTLWTGRASPKLPSSLPIWNSPPGIHTMPSGARSPAAPEDVLTEADPAPGLEESALRYESRESPAVGGSVRQCSPSTTVTTGEGFVPPAAMTA